MNKGKYIKLTIKQHHKMLVLDQIFNPNTNLKLVFICVKI